MCLSKPLPCQRGHKIYLNTWLPKISHANKDTKFIITCVDLTVTMLTRTQSSSQYVLTIPIPCQRRHKKYISKNFEKSHLMPTKTQYATPIAFTKPISCQLRHNIYFNLCWHYLSAASWQNFPQNLLTRPPQVSENGKCILNCVDQTPPTPTRT